MDFLVLILEIFYDFIKCIIKFFAWIFEITMKDIVISLLSISVLCCIIFLFIMPKFIFNILLLLIFICLVFKFRGKIRRYLNKKVF
ncbi:hypothetical protein SAMN05421784_12412 [Xenorhabdus koppenhoeferi]|uniref:Uncharacterized protein n=1 Tax=Xenorhabdus koppenhoeferi TaxID=351659 RepID=A0A1I7IVM6_9GAMM|nr:hypothetical protein SAMN05421784_12412 [Xenorhabdus koppenhoeferi]